MIEGFEMRTMKAIFTHLLQCLKSRKSLESMRFNEGNLISVDISADLVMEMVLGWSPL